MRGIIRLVTLLSAAVLALIAGGLLASNITQTATIQDQTSIISTLSANNDALRKQVQSQGQTPVAPPADDVIAQKGDPGAVGPAGPQGPGATDAQVSRQIEIYCAAHNDCAGPAGANGVGTNGQNGSDGAPGADSTIPGPQGAPGADGRGIASTVCDDSGEWQVTYTDGSTQDAGSCRMSLINP